MGILLANGIEMLMTPEQKKAIRRLESALKNCEENGIVLMGMDDSLIAYDKEEWDNTESQDGEWRECRDCPLQRMRSIQGWPVNDGGAYEGSGGW